MRGHTNRFPAITVEEGRWIGFSPMDCGCQQMDPRPLLMPIGMFRAMQARSCGLQLHPADAIKPDWWLSWFCGLLEPWLIAGRAACGDFNICDFADGFGCWIPNAQCFLGGNADDDRV
jgi:hypothetical protein